MSIATVDVAMENPERRNIVWQFNVASSSQHKIFMLCTHFSSQYKSITVKPSTRNDYNDLSEQTKHLPGPTPVPEQADFPPAPQKKVKRYFKWNDNYLVQYKLPLKDLNGKLFCKSCTAFRTKKLSSWKAGVWTRTALRTNIQEAWWKLEACCMHEWAWKNSCFSVK